jgi:hypothetical protein
MGQAVKQADKLLSEIKEVRKTLAQGQAKAEAELQAVTEGYQKALGPLQEELKGLEKELVKLMKVHKGDIFDGIDKVRLEHGFLLYLKELKLKLPKDALARIEAQGLEDGIRISKSLDRAAIEKWSTEKLFLIGGERKLKESFEYEVI